jgi:CHAD domain-containing protein
MVEEEWKYNADQRFSMPDLTQSLPTGGRVSPRPPITMRATYFDTADLRLARAGVSLRYRSSRRPASHPEADGSALPWTVKLPTGTPGSRHEVERPATGASGPRSSAAAIPADLLSLVTVYSRGSALVPTVTLRTIRTRYDLLGVDGEMLAEVSDDTVSVLDDRRVRSKFREIEVERKNGRRKLLRDVGRALETAGATTGAFTPKHVRALGDAALAPPDLHAPPSGLPRKPAASDVTAAGVQADIARIITHDPLVRLRATVGRGDTAVHQMRVGIRRLRSTLRTFAPLFDDSSAAPLRDELRWLGDALGGARDIEVARARLRWTAEADPTAPLDDASLARIDAELAGRHEEALVALDAALSSPRYHALVDTLIDVAAAPHLTPIAVGKAAVLLPRLVARAWQRLARGKHGVDGADELDTTANDEQWHAVRIRAKHARYAVELTAPVVGVAADGLASALADLVGVLGDHQDAVVAGATWLAIAAIDPDDLGLAVTAGRLSEREHAAARAAQDAYPAAWRAVDRVTLTRWLP